MATLPDPIFSSPPSSPPPPFRQPLPRHRRHPSSLSSTSSSPPAPALSPPLSDTASYRYLLSRHPGRFSQSAQSWDTRMSLLVDPPTIEEMRVDVDLLLRRRILKWKRVKSLANILLIVWSVYCGCRYVIALSRFASDALRRRYAIAFSAASLFAFLIFISHFIFSLKSPLHLSVSRWLRKASVPLLFAASSALMLVGAANVVLVILWRHSNPSRVNPAPQANSRSLHGRCLWDLDVVWAGVGLQCDPGIRWGYFLAGSIARLTLTCLFVLLFHFASHRYLSASKLPDTQAYARIVSGIGEVSTDPMTSAFPQSQRKPSLQHLSRRSSLHFDRRLSSTLAFPHASEQNERAEGELQNSGHAPSHSIGNEPPPPIQPSVHSTRTFIDTDRLQRWATEFRSLVDQVHAETEIGEAYATPDSTFDAQRSGNWNIRMVGGLVHRMSTIESLGSHYVSEASAHGASRKTSLRSRGRGSFDGDLRSTSRNDSFMSAREREMDDLSRKGSRSSAGADENVNSPSRRGSQSSSGRGKEASLDGHGGLSRKSSYSSAQGNIPSRKSSGGESLVAVRNGDNQEGLNRTGANSLNNADSLPGPSQPRRSLFSELDTVVNMLRISRPRSQSLDDVDISRTSHSSANTTDGV